MEAFENSFRIGYDYYIRYFDGNQSKIKKIPSFNERYIEDASGDFTYFLNPEIKLRRITKKTDLPVYGNYKPDLCYIRDFYWQKNYNKSPRYWFLDLETTAKRSVDTKSFPETIVCIQIYDSKTNTVIVFSLTDFIKGIDYTESESGNYTFNGEVFDFKLKYFKLNSEVELILAFFKLIKTLDPAIISAYNGEGFDFGYLFVRATKLGIPLNFSPYGESKLNELVLNQGIFEVDSPGISYIDYMKVYKNFNFEPKSSYSLDNIAEVEVGLKKVNHDCFKTFDGFRTGSGYIRPDSKPTGAFELELWNVSNSEISKNSKLNPADKCFESVENSEADVKEKIAKICNKWFIHYAIIDVYILNKIELKLRIFNTMTNMAEIYGVNIKDTVKTVMPWAQYIANSAYLKKQILPSYDMKAEDTSGIQLKGGFVMDPIKGKCNYGFSLDVNSMYPSQIMAFNISPETLVEFNDLPKDLQLEIQNLNLSEDELYHINEYFKDTHRFDKYSKLLQKYNLCGSLFGTHFDKSKKGIIPELIEAGFNNRKRYKSKMLEHRNKVAEIKKELELRKLI